MPSPALLGWRSLRQRPLAALVAIVCLGLGAGASAAALVLADATVLRPYGLSGAADLVVLWETDIERPQDMGEVSLPTFHDWQHRSSSFSSMAALAASHWPAVGRLRQGYGAQGRVRGESLAIAPRAVSRDFFRTVGRAPMLGRDFTEEDLVRSTLPPAMLSHAFWAARVGSRPDAVGESIFIDNDEHRVIGVMPKGFAFPDAPDVWISVERALQSAFERNKVTAVEQRAIGVLQIVARFKDGASRVHAIAELNAVERDIGRQFFPSRKPLVVSMTPFHEAVIGRLGARLWIAVAMTMAVLLFACANVASIRMAHLRERSGELAARACFGATGPRLFGELLLETVPLLIASAIVAAITGAGLEAWLRQVPAVASSGVELADYRGTALAALVLLAVVSWMLVSILPALAVAVHPRSIDLRTALFSSFGGFGVFGGGSSFGAFGGRSRTAPALLTLQAAIAVCLVAIAAGAFRTFARLTATDVGFSTTGVTAADISVPAWKYAAGADRARLNQQLLAAFERLPGITSAAGVSVRPFRFGEVADGIQVRRPEDVATDPNVSIAAARMIVTPLYFDAMNIAVLAGRAFTESDRDASPPVIVVSRSLARILWGDAPVGEKQIEMFALDQQWQRSLVVGVAADVRSRVIDRLALEVYVPHAREANPLSSYVVKHAADRQVTDAMLRAVLRDVDPDLALERVQTTRGIVDRVLAPSRLLSTAMSMLGATGLTLLVVGIFGAAATTLRVARREVAIRQAVGATPFTAARAPLRSLVIALMVGAAIGSAAAPGALRLLASMGVADAAGVLPALAGGALAVTAAAALAVALTMRPAMKAPPAELLRAE
jgi:predicted permease